MAARMLHEAILVHDPVRFGSFWSFSGVKNQSFFNSDTVAIRRDDFVGTRSLPVTRPGYSIGS